MTLNKGLQLPLPIKAYIKHWRDLQAEEASLSKDKTGKPLQKWQVQQIKIKQ